jgi:uncharacterized protein
MSEIKAPVEKLKAAYQEWHRSKGENIDPWTDLLADCVDFRSLANGQLGVPWTVNRTSLSEVHQYLKGLTDTFKMDYCKVDQYVCEGDTIVAIGSTAWHHRVTGKRAESPKVDVWRFGEDGKAVAFFEYYDTHNIAQAVQP